MYLCDECDERVHSANAIASRHERVRISTDAREDRLSGESAPRVHATTTSTRVSGGGHVGARAAATIGSGRGGGGDGVTDDVFGLYDEYISDMPATTFPIETLGGGFWGVDDALQVDAVLDTDKFLRDSPMGRSPSPEVANARARNGASSPSTESKPATLTRSEIEALQKLGSKKRGGQERLGPILDDSAIKFTEENPGYGNYESSSNETTFVAGQLDVLAGKMGTSSVKTEPSQVTVKVEPSDTANVPPPTEVQVPPGGFNIPMNLAQMQAGGATFPGADTYSGLPQPQTRLERLKRWKEKRKNRNFTKVIRYQSRKACADSRPRIKGKFVKVMSVPDLSKIRDVSEDADSDEELDKIDEEEARDTVGELGLDKGLRAPPSMSRLKKGLASSASMPDFSMYHSFD